MEAEQKEFVEKKAVARSSVDALSGWLPAIGICAAALCLFAVLVGTRHQPARHIRKKKAVAVVQRTVSVDLDPPGIVLHDSDSPGRVHGKLMGEAHLEETESEDHPNWRTACDGHIYHIGYHYVIRADGRIEKGRPDDCIGTHCRTHNDWIGICLIGGFSTYRDWWPRRPTPPQMTSLVALCEHLMSKYHIPPKYVKRHRDLNDTWCPGDRFPYRDLMRVLTTYAASHPETHPISDRQVSLAIPRPHQRRNYALRPDVTH